MNGKVKADIKKSIVTAFWERESVGSIFTISTINAFRDLVTTVSGHVTLLWLEVRWPVPSIKKGGGNGRSLLMYLSYSTTKRILGSL